jgi:aminopeptidase N
VKTIISSLLVGSFVLAGCTSTTKTIPNNGLKTPVRANTPYLSMQDAMQRSARISQVDYSLHFELTGEKSFDATTQARFKLNDARKPLTIDLDKATVKKLVVNGQTLTAEYNQSFITIPASALVEGENIVVVEFSRLHSTNGEGLHRFEDPVDGKVYLYSHFEPAAAHQMFALFDQPDLKANYELTVTTPADWTVISTMKETSVKTQGDKKYWRFDRTLKLSPYNFSMHAGPYHVWQDNSGKYPMRLFTRQSVAKQVNPADWFKYTKQGINFFENYYGIDYPFRKYDQILVPDFLYGAMENAAAITFAERGFLTNGEMTTSQKNRLASVILHEMAHQWFGNLVTMKWWNGLWLNESFAAFMQTMATASATEFTNEWQNFYAGGKQAAYTQDQRVTTHPIEVPVPSTANAFDNIDAITYSKGAAVLNQLRYLLGEEVFRRGIHNYLAQNAYQNAELDDFIKALADASGKNLDQWKQQWLYEAGVNTITAEYQCDNNQITSFRLHQTADDKFPTLREQRVQIGLFTADKQVSLINKVAVTYQGEYTEVPELKGSRCPDLVYPNYEDWGFVKVNLDARSFATAKQSLARVNDNLLRSMLWQSLYDSVRDINLPLNDYITIAKANIAKEQDYTVLGQALRQIASATRYLVKILGSDHPYVKSTHEQFAAIAWQKFQATANDTSMQRRWFNFFESMAQSPADINKLQQLLSGDLVISGFKLNQDIRWGIIATLAENNVPNAAQLIEQELAKDQSDTGQKSALYARVLKPSVENKAHWLAILTAKETALPFAKLRTIMAGLYPASQNELSKLTAEQRINTLPDLDANKGPVFMRSYAGLIPATCTVENVERLSKAIAEQTQLSAGTKRALLVTHQEEQRCVAMKSMLKIN